MTFVAGGSQDDDLFGGEGQRHNLWWIAVGMISMAMAVTIHVVHGICRAPPKWGWRSSRAIAGDIGRRRSISEPNGNRQIRELVDDVADEEVLDDYLSYD